MDRGLKKIPRAKEFSRKNKILVPVNTLDEVIMKFGQAAYCKIDVEGYGLNVLRGLHQCTSIISIEAIPESWDTVKRYLRYCNRTGVKEFNIKRDKAKEFSWEEWQPLE